jgi:hypothetical protein
LLLPLSLDSPSLLPTEVSSLLCSVAILPRERLCAVLRMIVLLVSVRI